MLIQCLAGSGIYMCDDAQEIDFSLGGNFIDESVYTISINLSILGTIRFIIKFWALL